MAQTPPLLRRARDRAAARLKPGFKSHEDARRAEDQREGTIPDGYSPLHAATWNVHSCVGLDARFAPDRVAGVIRGLNVDVIGLQEVGWHHRGETGIDQFAYLAEATGFQALSGPTKHNSLAHYGNAILTRLPVVETVPIDLSVPVREPRGALAAVLVVEGAPVRLIVAHLGLDPWERNVQVDRILDFIDAAEPMPTIFMGDLNEWRPSAPRLKRLAERLPDCAAPRSFHARLPTLRLDRIFVSGELKLAGYEVIRNAMTRRASDHLPVKALIGVPAKA